MKNKLHRTASQGGSAIRACFALCLLALSGQAAAQPGDQVQLDFDGRTLNGWMTRVEQPRATVLMLHGTMAHANMEIMFTLAEVLAENDIETLRVTLSLNVDDRIGMFPCDALHDHGERDALDELSAWMRWLAEQGRVQTLMLAHSRGAGQVAAFAASGAEPAPAGLILVAPTVRGAGDLALSYERRSGRSLALLVDRAREHVADGEPDAVLADVAFLHCEQSDVTARAFLAYYGQDDGVDALDLIGGQPAPVIVIAGGEDPLTERLGPEAGELAQEGEIDFVTVEGADHFFRDLYAYDVVDAIVEWLDRQESE